MVKKTIKDLESSLFLLGEELKDLKTKFDTHIEKNNTLLAKNDNLIVKYDILVGKHDAL